MQLLQVFLPQDPHGYVGLLCALVLLNSIFWLMPGLYTKYNSGAELTRAEMSWGRVVLGPSWLGAEMSRGRDVLEPSWFGAELTVTQEEHTAVFQ